MYAQSDGLVPVKGKRLVEMPIAIGLPDGTYGMIDARSGMTSKMGIAVGGGEIDADWTGEVMVILRIMLRWTARTKQILDSVTHSGDSCVYRCHGSRQPRIN